MRWLIPLALALAIPAGLRRRPPASTSTAASARSTTARAPPREIRDHYEIGMGELTVDLRASTCRPGDRTIDLDVGIGEARVIVRRDVCVVTQAEAGIGAVDVFGRETGGVDVDVDDAPPRAGRRAAR